MYYKRYRDVLSLLYIVRTLQIIRITCDSELDKRSRISILLMSNGSQSRLRLIWPNTSELVFVSNLLMSFIAVLMSYTLPKI